MNFFAFLRPKVQSLNLWICESTSCVIRGKRFQIWICESSPAQIRRVADSCPRKEGCTSQSVNLRIYSFSVEKGSKEININELFVKGWLFKVQKSFLILANRNQASRLSDQHSASSEFRFSGIRSPRPICRRTSCLPSHKLFVLTQPFTVKEKRSVDVFRWTQLQQDSCLL